MPSSKEDRNYSTKDDSHQSTSSNRPKSWGACNRWINDQSNNVLKSFFDRTYYASPQRREEASGTSTRTTCVRRSTRAEVVICACKKRGEMGTLYLQTATYHIASCSSVSELMGEENHANNGGDGSVDSANLSYLDCHSGTEAYIEQWQEGGAASILTLCVPTKTK